jgi:uncharacterized membrane protein HdeD (DUF308 family)
MKERVKRYFDFFMVMIYIVLGIIIIFSKEFFSVQNQTTKLIFGCILIIYGIFRAYRAIKGLNHDNPV